MSDDLLTIMWNKIAALTGGSAEWPIGLGLRPWYLKVATVLILALPWITQLCTAQVLLACVTIDCTLSHGVSYAMYRCKRKRATSGSCD